MLLWILSVVLGITGPFLVKDATPVDTVRTEEIKVQPQKLWLISQRIF